MHVFLINLLASLVLTLAPLTIFLCFSRRQSYKLLMLNGRIVFALILAFLTQGGAAFLFDGNTLLAALGGAYPSFGVYIFVAPGLLSMYFLMAFLRRFVTTIDGIKVLFDTLFKKSGVVTT